MEYLYQSKPHPACSLTSVTVNNAEPLCKVQYIFLKTSPFPVPRWSNEAGRPVQEMFAEEVAETMTGF